MFYLTNEQIGKLSRRTRNWRKREMGAERMDIAGRVDLRIKPVVAGRKIRLVKAVDRREQFTFGEVAMWNKLRKVG